MENKGTNRIHIHTGRLLSMRGFKLLEKLKELEDLSYIFVGTKYSKSEYEKVNFNGCNTTMVLHKVSRKENVVVVHSKLEGDNLVNKMEEIIKAIQDCKIPIEMICYLDSEPFIETDIKQMHLK